MAYKENEFPIGEFRYIVTSHGFIYDGYIKDVSEDVVLIVFHKKYLSIPTSELPHNCSRRHLKKSSIVAVYSEKSEAEEEQQRIKELNALIDDIHYGQ